MYLIVVFKCLCRAIPLVTLQKLPPEVIDIATPWLCLVIKWVLDIPKSPRNKLTSLCVLISIECRCMNKETFAVFELHEKPLIFL